MESNKRREASPIAIIFVVFQVMLFIILGVAVFKIQNESVSENDLDYNKKMPEVSIKDLAKRVPSLKEDEVSNIQKKVFKIVSENADNIDTGRLDIVIREGSLHAPDFGESAKYLRALIDIPSLEQSYELFYGGNAMLDPEVSTFVLCPNETDSAYEFKCKSSDDASIRNKVAATYLRYFRHDKISAYIDLKKDTKLITISPSVTHNNSANVKKQFIEDTKAFIKSLGLNADSYNYYVRTAADVNYNN